MNKILSEKQYQRYIIDYLVNNNGFFERTDADFDRYFAMDKGLLMQFLTNSQPDEMARLKKTYKDNLETTLVNKINNDITQKGSSFISVLKNGVDIGNVHLDLMYTKPATSFNPNAVKQYNYNILSVAEEVYAKDDERIDLVIFLNGFAIMTFELKANTAGQTYTDAIRQYREDRDPKSRLFLFKAGAVVNFAMDFEEVYMTTALKYGATYFLPFNMGNGESINAGKGNPVNQDGFGVSYMWEDILTKDTILLLLSKFVFVETEEKTDKKTGKKKTVESVIFPRYHQLDFLRKALADVKENRTDNNYLVQHSAGSGKTKCIAWLAHQLVSLHDENDKVVFNNIVICTDRIVVDRQLQTAIKNIDHKAGVVKVMDEKCTSADLATALSGNTKIVATTIQKFPYIIDSVKNLQDKTFAVIIDEAHSSTAGKEMAAVTRVLGSDGEEYEDVQDAIEREIEKNGKQKNVSMFAFTATPKGTTLALFGRLNGRGLYEPFHTYSMKQAIEEGFILDVLDNYVTYDTFYTINKEIETDPLYQTKKAKKQIARFAMLHDTNIAQRVEIIAEHFKDLVENNKTGLGYESKAMVVTGSRPEAVKYYYAFKRYFEKKNIKDLDCLVAFSGKVSDKQIGRDGDNEYTESSINGFPEKQTSDAFDTDKYQVLIVANKYQTGFDQPKLCAMYILKKLKGVNAVQTLSRLNRVYGDNKKTFILDFVNNYDDIKKAFDPYYTATILLNGVTVSSVYDLELKVDGYNLFSVDDIDSLNKVIYEEDDKKKAIPYLSASKKIFDGFDAKKRYECRKSLNGFMKCYEFVIQVSSLNDTELHKKYNYVSFLISYLGKEAPGPGFNLADKINATNYDQRKTGEHGNPDYVSTGIKLTVADKFKLTEDKEERLSKIIKDVNSRTGSSWDNDVVYTAALQLKDIMRKNQELVASAKANTLNDFENAFYKNMGDSLAEGWEQNQDFYGKLLEQPELQKEILGIFVEAIYKEFRGE